MRQNQTATEFNIHSIGSRKEFTLGKVHLYVMGGWGIRKNGFNVVLKHLTNSNLVSPRNWCWPLQEMFQTKEKPFIKAKRIFTFDIPVAGTYEIVFQNPDSLKLNPSPLFLGQLIFSDVDNREIEVVFNDFKKVRQ